MNRELFLSLLALDAYNRGFGVGIAGFFKLFLASLILPSFSACTLNESEYHVRMTVEVETPEGIRTGSSVYEVGAGNKTRLASEEGSRYHYERGEAVAVDLPDGRVLLALIKTGGNWGDITTMTMEAMDPQFTEHYDTVGSAARLERGDGMRSPATLDPEIYPMLVTFGDMNNPASVKLIDPANFGEGYALKRITVQLTDDPVTRGIEKRLGWLSKYPDPRLDNNFRPTSNPTLAQRLKHGDLARGIE